MDFRSFLDLKEQGTELLNSLPPKAALDFLLGLSPRISYWIFDGRHDYDQPGRSSSLSKVISEWNHLLDCSESRARLSEMGVEVNLTCSGCDMEIVVDGGCDLEPAELMSILLNAEHGEKIFDRLERLGWAPYTADIWDWKDGIAFYPMRSTEEMSLSGQEELANLLKEIGRLQA